MNTILKNSLLGTLLVASGIALSSCGGGDGTAGSGASKTKLAFITNAAADFWFYCEAGVKKAETELGDVEIIFKIGDGTAGKQKQIVDDLIVSGVKGIGISPVDPRNQKDMIDEWATKATLITVDSDAPDSDRICYLGTDNIAAGRQAGELVKEALPNGGKIMVFVGLGDAQNAIERYKGVKEAVAGTNIEVIDLRTDNVDFGKARRNAEDTLTKYPDIAAMVGLWSYNAPLILEALRDKNKVGDVKVIAFDEDPRTLQAIDNGEIFGTVVQNPYEFGYQSMKLVHGIVVEGKSPEELGVPESGQIIVDTKIIRKGEGQAYLDYCNGLKAALK
ncbi:MAG: ribose transport system substrate-binding protein [Verrucomicrobiales bacterium]|jgi:ribose transport system substrate-binding protein